MKKNKEIINAINWYKNLFPEFEKNLNGEKETFAHKIRRQAIEQLETVGFPTLKTEDWKYTNVLPIIKNNFTPVVEETLSAPASVKDSFFDLDSYRIVFYNGTVQKSLSDISDLPKGVIVENLKTAIQNFPDIVEEYLGKYSQVRTGFDVLNSAYFRDGLLVFLPANAILTKPLQILFYSDSDNSLLTYRNLLVVGKNSEGKIIFNYKGTAEKKYFLNSSNEAIIEENAHVELLEVQSQSEEAFHIEKSEVKIKQDGTFNHYSFSFGGRISRNDIYAELDGENISCNLYGLYLGKEKQHIDNFTFINHSKPNSSSEEFYKGILDDESHGVFAGKILVSPNAQKTNAYQSNKTVLLSEKATIDTKPQLEIYADDVKCSHGATVGRLDKEQFFYILSRGIPEKIARSMLITAFANDVLTKVKFKEVREALQKIVSNYLTEN